MHRFKRPSKPKNFEADIGTYRQAIRVANNNDTDLPWDDNRWKRQKAVFARAQHDKCGLCEMKVIGVDDGDVEHFRPKDAVWEILDEGRELPGLSSVRGRRFNKLSSKGYWWLGYEWNNWFLSCQVCNRKWKRAFFPIKEQGARSLPPEEENQEIPLLLNPYSGPNPIKHLKYGRLGEIEPRNGSELGRQSIRVYGLWRPSLMRSRQHTAEDVHFQLDRLGKTNSGRKADEYLKDIHRWGQADRVHCGVVRAIFEDRTKISWNQLDQLVLNMNRETTDG